MKDSEFLHILSKYKFVLAIENAVCPDYITEKLWKVIQVGAVPVYFGAPNIQEWLPNELSAILVEDFASAKDLADHLHHLNRNEEEYLAYLRQKPSINSNKLSRISNEYLIQAMNIRSWGVSDNDQMSKGNKYSF